MAYKKGQSGNPAGRPKKQTADEKAEEQKARLLPVGDEDEPTAMQHVMRSPVDRTYQHYQLRRIWEKTPDEFRKEYFSLIRARLRAGQSSGSRDVGASSTAPPPTPPTGPPSTLDHVPPVLRELLAPEFEEIEEYHRHREEFKEFLASRSAPR